MQAQTGFLNMFFFSEAKFFTPLFLEFKIGVGKMGCRNLFLYNVWINFLLQVVFTYDKINKVVLP